LNFIWVCGDDLVEAKLKPFLEWKGFKGVDGVAAWMGQPYEPQYPRNSALYLNEEAAVVKEAIRRMQESDERLVIDTTGSVVYLGDEILGALRGLSTVVLLDAPEGHQEILYQKYLAEPKPVIWGDVYHPLHGEDARTTLARCYPLLLKSRNELYRRHAHIVLGYDVVRAPAFDGQRFLKATHAAHRN
jgi:hypothetical protein